MCARGGRTRASRASVPPTCTRGCVRQPPDVRAPPRAERAEQSARATWPHRSLTRKPLRYPQVQTEEDAKRMFERSAVFLLATLSIEVDRLEHIIRTAYPEFKYIDLEVL